jgi:cell shape-determining protein MreD
MPLLAVGMVKPVSLYLMLLYVSFEWHWERTFALALLIGLIRDGVGSHPFGVETTVLCLVSVGLDFVVRKIERKAWMMRFALTFLYLFLVFTGVLIVSGLLGYRNFVTWTALGLCFQTAVYTTLGMPFFFFFTSRWFARRQVVRQYELFN